METISNNNKRSDSPTPLSLGITGTGGSGHIIGYAPFSIVKWIPALIPLAYLWFRLVNNLRLEWTTNPQYGYGLLVPFLCLGLIIRRWVSFTEVGKPAAKSEEQRVKSTERVAVVLLLIGMLAFLYLPTRLIEAATPEWRPIQWALGIEAAGLTLGAIYLGAGRGWFRQLAFPICFFFVAIPWPTLLEAPIVPSFDAGECCYRGGTSRMGGCAGTGSRQRDRGQHRHGGNRRSLQRDKVVSKQLDDFAFPGGILSFERLEPLVAGADRFFAFHGLQCVPDVAADNGGGKKRGGSHFGIS